MSEQTQDATRYVCTAEAPYTRERAAVFSGRVTHPDATFVRSLDALHSEYDEFLCPHCGLRFQVEVER